MTYDPDDHVAKIIAATSNSAPIQVTFWYDRRDPWAVQLIFGAKSGPVEWVIARELLQAALSIRVPVGHGDVKIKVVGQITELCLTSHAGHAHVQLRTRDLQLALADSYACVPGGAEDQHVDWPGELSRILDEERAS